MRCFFSDVQSDHVLAGAYGYSSSPKQSDLDQKLEWVVSMGIRFNGIGYRIHVVIEATSGYKYLMCVASLDTGYYRDPHGCKFQQTCDESCKRHKSRLCTCEGAFTALQVHPPASSTANLYEMDWLHPENWRVQPEDWSSGLPLLWMAQSKIFGDPCC